MAVMKSTDFIKKLKEIESLPTVYYSVAGGNWAKWNGKSWNFDCVILVKAILWGWNGDKKASHGGAKYASNGVYDDNADQIMKRCTRVSTDFSKIAPGEILWMAGHVGVYIGNGKVIECTAAWEGKVVYSDINTQGKRSRNGKTVGYWKKHGTLSYINYVSEEPAPTPQPKPEATLKYKEKDKIILNGYVYRDSLGNARGMKFTNHKGTITKTANGARKPYHIDKLGWVAESDIKPQETKPATNKVYKKVANCTWLNLRTSPQYGNNIYKSVRAGTVVEYLGMENGWAKVDYNGKVVYCGSGYLK